MNPASPFYGMTQAQLQAALASAQQAYLALMSGQRTVNLSYTQGDGSKSVTYDRVEGGIAQVRILILELQQALGNLRRLPRRFARFSFGSR
jgi:hypothetical protein